MLVCGKTQNKVVGKPCTQQGLFFKFPHGTCLYRLMLTVIRFVVINRNCT